MAQRVGRGIALLFLDHGTRRGWVVSSTPRPHFTPGKDPVPILQEAGWAPGPVWTGGKSRPHRDSIPDRPARSQSLYRLSYRAQVYCEEGTKFFIYYWGACHVYIIGLISIMQVELQNFHVAALSIKLKIYAQKQPSQRYQNFFIMLSSNQTFSAKILSFLLLLLTPNSSLSVTLHSSLTSTPTFLLSTLIKRTSGHRLKGLRSQNFYSSL